jgi:diguanylate cyclase (GGDEF)-like protein
MRHDSSDRVFPVLGNRLLRERPVADKGGVGALRHILAAPATPLSDVEWDNRHRRVVLLLAAQAVVVAAWALLAGFGVVHALADVLPPAAGLLVACSGRASRLVRACAATLGLFAVSAVVVHLSEGAPVAHFHFFVMLIVLAQYEDPRPFALGIATVVVQHGVMGALLPGSAFPADETQPWAQAAVHGGFVLAAALALVLNWRTNEALRRREMAGRLALARERDDLSLLRRVSREVVASTDPRDPLVRGAAELIGAPVVGLLELDGGDLVVTAVHGAPDLLGARIEAGSASGALTAIRTGRPVFVGDAQAPGAPLSPSLVAHAGTRSAAFHPVAVEGRPAGVLGLSWPFPQPALGERADALLALMADEAAVALGRRAARRRLEEAALTDPLTGVPNRRAWDAVLPRELERSRRSGAPLSVALVDLNAFKAINDREGHEAGDRVLQAAAQAWTETLRSTDIIARLGGDEFGVVLPDCPAEEAMAVGARLRAATPHAGGAAVGIATWDGAEDQATLLRRADAALYVDKAGGADRPGAPYDAALAELEALAERVRADADVVRPRLAG